MLEAVDYSGRRGVIVQFLPQVYEIILRDARADRAETIEPPENIIFWKQRMRKELVDTSRRYIFLMENDAVRGFAFYRFGEGSRVYLDEFQVTTRGGLDLLLTKLQQDTSLAAKEFYAGGRIRVDRDEEMLAAVKLSRGRGEDGFESLGGLSETVNILRLRYGQG